MEKFDRNKEHASISNIMNNIESNENPEAKLSILKAAEATLRDIANAKKAQGAEGINFDEIQMASTEGMEHIGIDNDHLYLDEIESKETNHKTR